MITATALQAGQQVLKPSILSCDQTMQARQLPSLNDDPMGAMLNLFRDVPASEFVAAGLSIRPDGCHPNMCQCNAIMSIRAESASVSVPFASGFPGFPARGATGRGQPPHSVRSVRARSRS